MPPVEEPEGMGWTRDRLYAVRMRRDGPRYVEVVRNGGRESVEGPRYVEAVLEARAMRQRSFDATPRAAIHVAEPGVWWDEKRAGIPEGWYGRRQAAR